MKNKLLALLGFLAVTSLAVYRPSIAADLAAAEAAVRKADADWVAAARTTSVEAWMAFYAADAMMFLPNDRLASDQERVRLSVSRLLALPHLSIAWSPSKVEVTGSGEQALLIEGYELRFDDSRGAPVSDRGRRLEIWRKQANGIWKCVVDTWNLDEAVMAAAPLASVQGALPIPDTAAPPAQPSSPPSPPPTVVLSGGPPKPTSVMATKYGEIPTNYEDAIRKYFPQHLKYPNSIQIREITSPEQGYTTAITGTFLMRETHAYGWTVTATINAKNSRDSYVGFKTYTFLFRGEKIVDVRLPLPGDEMGEPMPD